MKNKNWIIASVLALLLVALAGCGQPKNNITDTPPVTSEVSPPESSTVVEMEKTEYNGLSFECDAAYESKEKDEFISIIFEKGVATLDLSFMETKLTDRETETALVNGALISSFSETKDEKKNDVDINGVTSKSTTALVKGESTPWLNALCLTVPTKTGNVSFLYLQALESGTDYTDVFGEIMESITVE